MAQLVERAIYQLEKNAFNAMHLIARPVTAQNHRFLLWVVPFSVTAAPEKVRVHSERVLGAATSDFQAALFNALAISVAIVVFLAFRGIVHKQVSAIVVLMFTLIAVPNLCTHLLKKN